MKKVTPSKSTARRKLLFTETRPGLLQATSVPALGTGLAQVCGWHLGVPGVAGSSTRRGRRLSLFWHLSRAWPWAGMDVAGLGRVVGLRPPPPRGLGWCEVWRLPLC